MQASVRRFCPLHKTINRGNGTEYLLHCCPAARILHSERPHRACARIDNNGWVAQLAEQWTENPRVGGSIPPPATFSLIAVIVNPCALKRLSDRKLEILNHEDLALFSCRCGERLNLD